MTLATAVSLAIAREPAITRSGLLVSPDRAFGRYELREAFGAERARTEHFIAERYKRDFDARIEAFMPRLFSLRATAAGEHEAGIEGALGLRNAQGRLFVEQYLDVPIEDAIRAATGQRIERAAIVEVGHFAGVRPGTMRTMILLLADRLHREGAAWVAFAGTRALCNAFLRMHLQPIALCPAACDRLPAASRGAWGTYYRNDPWVYVGPVRDGAAAIDTIVDMSPEQNA
jgi:thermostable hemolysin